MKQEGFVHQGIRKVAMELCGEYYELAAQNDEFYVKYPDQNEFINTEWPHFIEETRRVLAKMLQNPAHPQQMKDEIYDMLLADHTLPYSHQDFQIIN